MIFSNNLADKTVLIEIGKRLERYRLDRQLTQAVLAEQAGVSKRTVERVEAGASVQLATIIRILRVLGLLEGLETLIPETGIRPMDLLQLRGEERQRASKTRRNPDQPHKEWSWDDET